MPDYRPGSMGAKEEKEKKIFVIVFTVIFSIVYLLWLVPSGLYSHYYFKNAGFWKFIGFASIAVHYWFIWKKFRDIQTGEGDKGSPAWLLFGWFGLNLVFLSGFNFSLPPGA